MKKLTLLTVGVLLLALSAFAQIKTVNQGAANALDFAYGMVPGAPALQVISGSAAAGSYSVIVANGTTTTADGTVFAPLNLNAPISIGTGAAFEVVPAANISAVSCTTPTVYGTCTLTATFTYAHGMGDMIKSGTAGFRKQSTTFGT